MRKTVETPLGKILLDMAGEDWQSSLTSQECAPGLSLVRLKLVAEEARAVPPVTLSWSIPGGGVCYRWHYLAGLSGVWLPPDWHQPLESQLAIGTPVVCLYDLKGMNRLTYALSDALNPIGNRCGIHEADGRISVTVSLFSTPAAPRESYELVLRLDSRQMGMEEALAEVAAWWASMPDYSPQAVPEAALHPLYSTWYSYHQDISAGEVEEECRQARRYGLKTVIVDDGWQTEDHSGGYGYCGDWEICKKRFPDMRQHVEKVHAMGMKYVLWYSMPWMGTCSGNFERFRDKLLYVHDGLHAGALDPRFPEVREYLIGIYEQAIRDWNLDGFKLDFIDSFCFMGGVDPAVAEGYAGRDYKLLPEAVDRLLTDVTQRLHALKPDILLEFRQRYIGPAMRKYGNMFRVGDCPGDIITNRLGIVNLRLLSGNTAVHGDMLRWNADDSAEVAARQLLAVFFGVPQISVRLNEIPDSHRRMLSFYLGIWEEYRSVILGGRLRVFDLAGNAPMVSALGAGVGMTVVYQAGRCLHSEFCKGAVECMINATAEDVLLVDLKEQPCLAETYDVEGELVSQALPSKGLQKLSVPASGLIKLHY